uniref:Uncharacterized protein n=1 Tax=Manihot esculenta TaxID=3983 RepID=A0A2C9W729_MANES
MGLLQQSRAHKFNNQEYTNSTINSKSQVFTYFLQLTQVQQHTVALAGSDVRHNRGLEAREALLVPESGPRTMKGSRLEARHRDSKRTEGYGISTAKLPTARRCVESR